MSRRPRPFLPRRLIIALTGLVAAVLLAGLAAGPVAARDSHALRWHRAAGSPSFENALVESVAAGPRGLVAVGASLAGGQFHAAAWTSRDGETWRAALVTGSEREELHSVTRWGDRFLAVGDHAVVRNGVHVLDGVVYVSRDGRRWDLVDTGSTFHSAQLLNVASGGQQVIAAGCRGATRFGCLFADPLQASIWTSTNARAWRPASVQDGASAFVNAVTRSPNGLVAVGSEVSVEVDEEGFLVSSPVATAIWTSRDGRVWSRASQPEAFDSGSGSDVTWAHGLTVAVGDTFACPNVWTSRAGSLWSGLPDSEPLCGELGALMNGVASGHGLFVATGFFLTESATDVRPPAVWISSNGRDWTLDDDPGLTVSGLGIGFDVIPWRSGFLVAGVDGGAFGQDLSGAIWIGLPPP